MRLERLGQLKNPVTSSEIKPATFRIVAECLNQLRYRVPQIPTVGEALLNIYWITQCRISEDTFHNCLRENLKSHKL
jgi:hypothetical protein